MLRYILFLFITLHHKLLVFWHILVFSIRLIWRGIKHDNSKIFTSEIYWYGKYLPLFKGVKYGTPEYDALLKNFQHSINHHYQLNPHHPEHNPEGYLGMSLLDIVEMYHDWFAASKKSVGTRDFNKSLDINGKRFGMSDDLIRVFKNSIK